MSRFSSTNLHELAWSRHTWLQAPPHLVDQNVSELNWSAECAESIDNNRMKKKPKGLPKGLLRHTYYTQNFNKIKFSEKGKK